MAELGKDRNPYRAGFLQFVGVAETSEEAMEIYREPAEYFYNRCLHVNPRWAQPPGYTTEATLRAKGVSQVLTAAQRAADKRQGKGPTFEEIVDKGYVVIGSPDEVAEQLRKVAVDLNVGHLMLLHQFGDMKKDVVNHNTELFSSQVMPQLRELFASEWEDRWWPQPMAADKRQAPGPVS